MRKEQIEVTTPKEWVFLYEEPDNGWWLKIDNVNDLIWYHQNVIGLYEAVLEDFRKYRDIYEKTGNLAVFPHTTTQAVVQYAENRNLNILDAITQMRMMAAGNQMEDIHAYGYIVMNRAGGYHPGPIEHTQFVRRKTCTWPDFKESDIRVSQFPGGTHWYAYIGEMQLRNGGDVKWNRKEDAYRAALQYVNQT